MVPPDARLRPDDSGRPPYHDCSLQEVVLLLLLAVLWVCRQALAGGGIALALRFIVAVSVRDNSVANVRKLQPLAPSLTFVSAINSAVVALGLIVLSVAREQSQSGIVLFPLVSCAVDRLRRLLLSLPHRFVLSVRRVRHLV